MPAGRWLTRMRAPLAGERLTSPRLRTASSAFQRKNSAA
jgi:hypothetical protein